MTALQSILVPADGSAASLAAIEHAVLLAEDAGATLDMLHILAPEDPRAPAARESREIQRSLNDAFDLARSRLGARISRKTEVGDPLRMIVKVASEGGYDLIVIGTHGRVGRLHALIGSVAEGVVRNAPCPVLTVREPGAGYQSFAERRHGRPTLAEQSAPRH